MPPDLAAFGTETVTVGDEQWLVAVADTPDERSQGLRRVADLGALDGMIFIYTVDTDTRFTMRTVPIALDIGCFDGSGALVEVAPMAPCGDCDACPLYAPSSPFRPATERPAAGEREVPTASRLHREN